MCIIVEHGSFNYYRGLFPTRIVRHTKLRSLTEGTKVHITLGAVYIHTLSHMPMYYVVCIYMKIACVKIQSYTVNIRTRQNQMHESMG